MTHHAKANFKQQGREGRQSWDLSIIIVNFNTSDLLMHCLESIEGCGMDIEVFIVDNASSDNSLQNVRTHYKHVHLIANEKNNGFGKANNQAIKMATGRHLLFLNPDTKVLPGALKIMVNFMDEHPAIGLAGPRMVNPDGSSQPSIEYRYPGQRYAGQEMDALAGDIAWVLGACIIARCKTIEQLRGFDENFFLYAEEIDLCLRARQLGWKIGFIADAAVIHLGGGSERNSLPALIWHKRIGSEIIFYRKHYKLKSLRAIRRANLIQAYWRIFSLKLTLPFLTKKTSAKAKLEKYCVVLDRFKKDMN